MGDLNNVMNPDEKSSSNINASRIQCFNHFVKRCGLVDLAFNGPAYTWCNKRFTSTPVYERLDSCLANADWCASFPNTNVYNLPIILIDHTPGLTITGSSFRRPRFHFKFENWWLMEEDFQSVPKT
ncbi:hypothetical protein BRADI_1g69641v3, partial [Brachypodium distachyon]